ncbi:MAG: methylmalonyl Co-A mutase-associated GTPase MeaB [Bacteroidetes bacterium]|nr:methylmalonyl Co-A mutase-associated GTPase MeaB [Bacteroidota bacterium]
MNIKLLSDNLSIPDYKTLARTISLVENEVEGFEDILHHLQPKNIPVVGFTGPPGAGKSTLLNAVLSILLGEDKKIGLILIDPSSPFNLGALLGDRLRMSAHFTNPNLYIRSLATRGSLGGLSDKIIEVVEVMRSYPFDYLFIETVGVGQSEVEIAGLADTTVVILVPEAGDSVQTMKAGLMEIADIFVINKSDRADAEALVSSLSNQLQLNGKEHLPILKTVAVDSTGVPELIAAFKKLESAPQNQERKLVLLSEKAVRIISKNKMKNFDLDKMKQALSHEMNRQNFNLYSFVQQYL